MAGSDKSIQAAISRGQMLQFNRVVKTLVDNGHVRTMIFHWFGNYTLQDLVTASSKLRSVTINVLEQLQVNTLSTCRGGNFIPCYALLDSLAQASRNLTMLCWKQDDPAFKDNAQIRGIKDICVGRDDLLGTPSHLQWLSYVMLHAHVATGPCSCHKPFNSCARACCFAGQHLS